jgi:transposase
MLTLPRSVRIFLSSKPVDMRCGFDALSRRVTEFGQDPFSGHLFVFVSRRGDRVKILSWDHGGFVLWYKRLESGRFRLPASAAQQGTMMLDSASLAMLLDGIDYSRVRRPKHWQPKTISDRHRSSNVVEAGDGQ